MNVVIIGAGYVGLNMGAALAWLGHQVTVVEKSPEKLAILRAGHSPIHEPGLDGLLRQLAGTRLHFCGEVADVAHGAEVIVIAVGTPPTPTGEADLQYVESAAREVAVSLAEGSRCTLLMKSTVPIGTHRRIAHIVERTLAQRGATADVHVMSNPEFLREGMALYDMFYPDRIVVGAEHAQALDAAYRLYRPILEQTFEPPRELPRPEGYPLPPLITTDPTSAEMTKYAANAFLALKISFINEISGLCERVGADVTEVARGIGLDRRIGHRFLEAGLGWGGSCFPKDTAALIAVGQEHRYAMPIVEASCVVNARQRQMMVDKLQHELKSLRGRVIAVLGLAFKPNTDDVRESPAGDIIRMLCERGAHVRAHDPVALENARIELTGLDIEFCPAAEEATRGADAVLIATDWPQYRQLDFALLAAGMKRPLLVDGRNMVKPAELRAAGWTYLGVGR